MWGILCFPPSIIILTEKKRVERMRRRPIVFLSCVSSVFLAAHRVSDSFHRYIRRHISFSSFQSSSQTVGSNICHVPTFHTRLQVPQVQLAAACLARGRRKDGVWSSVPHQFCALPDVRSYCLDFWSVRLLQVPPPRISLALIFLLAHFTARRQLPALWSATGVLTEDERQCWCVRCGCACCVATTDCTDESR